MGATVVTISPRIPAAEYARRIRVWVERDGVVELAASSGDRQQMRQLRRVEGRLTGDVVYFPRHCDGVTSLVVLADPPRAVCWRGDPKTG